jgi:hypothetical protein
MALPGPESARGWLGVLYPLMERGGGVLALAFLLIGGSIVWFLIGALERSVVRNHQLVERLHERTGGTGAPIAGAPAVSLQLPRKNFHCLL